MEKTRINEAVVEYLKRQDRTSHPAGRFDKGGRFYLADVEIRACCHTIRTPSRRWPYSEMTHGRTIKHVAMLFDVEPAELRRAVQAARQGKDND